MMFRTTSFTWPTGYITCGLTFDNADCKIRSGVSPRLISMSHWYGLILHMTYLDLRFKALVKLSITCFNMRLTGLSSRRWMYAHWTFFAALVMYIIAAVFLVTFQCVPAVAGWDSIGTGHLDKKPKCLSEETINNPLIIVHIIMDFCLLAVPVLVLWKLKIRPAVKIRLYLLFSVGCLCCFAAIMRKVAQDHLKKDVTCNP